MFERWPVEEVWGIDAALAARLRPLGVRTAADLVALPPAVARGIGTVVLERLVLELDGIECGEFAPEPKLLQATAVTGCFLEPVSDASVLREAMVRRAVRSTEKIRAQGPVATRLIAFAHGSRFKPNAPSATRSGRLSPASHDTRVTAALAGSMADAMFVAGSIYTKCGVLLEGRHAQGAMQADLFAAADPKASGLLVAVDGLNRRFGRQTVRLAAERQGERIVPALGSSGLTRRVRVSPAFLRLTMLITDYVAIK